MGVPAWRAAALVFRNQPAPNIYWVGPCGGCRFAPIARTCLSSARSADQPQAVIYLSTIATLITRPRPESLASRG